jgi:hypothetical protein
MGVLLLDSCLETSRRTALLILDESQILKAP